MGLMSVRRQKGISGDGAKSAILAAEALLELPWMMVTDMIDAAHFQPFFPKLFLGNLQFLTD